MPRSHAAVLALFAVALVARASAGDADGHETRVEVQGYVAGAGDALCFVYGLGCVVFDVRPGESAATIALDDEVHDPVGFDVCSPDCDGVSGSFCGSGSVSGLREGDMLTVFVSEASGPQHCKLANVGVGLKGQVTATFT